MTRFDDDITEKWMKAGEKTPLKSNGTIPLDDDGWPLLTVPGIFGRKEYIVSLQEVLDAKSLKQKEVERSLREDQAKKDQEIRQLETAQRELQEAYGSLEEKYLQRRATQKRPLKGRRTNRPDLDVAIELAEVTRELEEVKGSRSKLASIVGAVRRENIILSSNLRERKEKYDRRILEKETQRMISFPVLRYFTNLLEQLNSDSLRSYETIRTETETELAPLLARGGDLGVELVYNAAEVLMNKRKTQAVRQARVLYEIVQANTKDQRRIDIAAEIRLLEIALCNPSEGDSSIATSFDKLAKEDPLLKTARDYRLGEIVEKITATAMKDKDLAEIDPAILFTRAAYQLRNSPKVSDKGKNIHEEQLLENILGRDQNFISQTVELIGLLGRKAHDRKAALLQVVYTAVEKISDPELEIRIGLRGLYIYDTKLSAIVEKMKGQKGDYQQVKDARIQLTDFIKSNPIGANPLYHTAHALRLQKEYGIAEEIGIALAAATKDPKYWKLIGDIVQESPTAERDNRKAWAKQCYQKAGLQIN